MNEITIHDLLKLKEKVQIIDIREKYEYDNGHINSIHIPMGQILESKQKISKEKTVVIYCQSGRRAAAVVYMLNNKFHFNNVYNLIGGYSAYKDVKQTQKIN